MDLALIKQKQGETLREYMRRFFEKGLLLLMSPRKKS
jgi:hypothetical protein